MVDQNLTEIVCVVDRSGSMSVIRDDAIGGFNSFLKDQKALDKPCRLTYVQFDDKYEVIHNAVPLAEVPLLTAATYVPRGWTALYDAVGRTIDMVGARLAALPEAERPAKIIFLILTDGQENSSKEYETARINEMITHQREAYQWEFVFLAANQDAMMAGNKMGIKRNFNFATTGKSVKKVYDNASASLCSYRAAPDVAMATVALDSMADNAMDVQDDVND
jgi:uncharacterized protein YegL